MPKTTRDGRPCGYAILVVEGELGVQLVLRETLSYCGYMVASVDNGPQAIEAARSSHFDLVITDLIMPGGLNGVDILRAVRNLDPDCGVIVMTPDVSPEIQRRLLEVGADDCWSKPFSLSAVTAKVASVLQRRHGS